MVAHQIAPRAFWLITAEAASRVDKRLEETVAGLGTAKAIHQQRHGNPAPLRGNQRVANPLARLIFNEDIIEQTNARPGIVDQGDKRIQPLRPVGHQRKTVSGDIGQPVKRHIEIGHGFSSRPGSPAAARRAFS